MTKTKTTKRKRGLGRQSYSGSGTSGNPEVHSVSVQLTNDQLSTLDNLSRKNCRSRAGQVLYLVENAIRAFRSEY